MSYELKDEKETGVKIFNLQSSIFNSFGFTLIELLISMTIGLIVLGSIFSSFTTQKKAFATQEMITEMEQNLRFAMEFITRDLRNAGYNPNIEAPLLMGTSVGIVPGTDSTVTTNITANSIRMLSDLNDDGDTADDNETVRYFLNGTDLRRNNNPMVQYITGLTFTYYNSSGATITVPITTAGATDLSNIRLIDVSITARTSREDPNYTSGGLDITGTDADGMCRTRTLTARIRTRNIGLRQTY
ncbi:MAG: hypothetical protein A2W77_06610 [Nitrospinae bacterium RIFCSPLOWO2_12_39_16]|nr:MAG: hypothetical protein A2W77_06610 [Nitrospinae bacterium RIFCSPLOWO2_12_39_16]